MKFKFFRSFLLETEFFNSTYFLYQYRKYWKHFYKNIPLKGIIFMATTKMTESNDVYDQPLDDDEYKKLS